jgi:peptidoglycan/LPS O-acetylase OafA/YrhL
VKYRPELDGMRALAISAVLLTHAYHRPLPGGWIGVDLFFLLSGYLITTLLLREIDTTGTIALARFYLRRSLRLMPALALVLGFVAVVEYLVKPAPDGDSGWSILMAGTYLMNWNKALGWGGEGVLGHTWSLSIEEQFYLVWPLVLLAIPGSARLRTTFVLLVAIIGWKWFLIGADASAERIYNGFDTHADSLLMGCCLAQLRIEGPTADRLSRLWLIPVALLGGFVMTMHYERVFSMTSGIVLVGISGAWLIVASARPGLLRRILSHQAPVFVGRISYGVYLWHGPMLFYFRNDFPPALAIVPVLFAMPLAAASYRWVERPILRLRDRRQSKDGSGKSTSAEGEESASAPLRLGNRALAWPAWLARFQD